jgi:hypothetical protein
VALLGGAPRGTTRNRQASKHKHHEALLDLLSHRHGKSKGSTLPSILAAQIPPSSQILSGGKVGLSVSGMKHETEIYVVSNDILTNPSHPHRTLWGGRCERLAP